MNLKEESKKTVEIIKLIFKNKKYWVVSIVFALVILGLLYYFLVAKVARNNFWISVQMSGPTFITASVVGILATAILSGILLSMIIFKFNLYRGVRGGGIFGFIGSGIAAFGVGCPTCGAFLFGLIGMPLVLMYLPFSGLELQFLGIILLLLSIYFTGKSVYGSCKVK